jgi:hypothetical protein
MLAKLAAPPDALQAPPDHFALPPKSNRWPRTSSREPPSLSRRPLSSPRLGGSPSRAPRKSSSFLRDYVLAPPPVCRGTRDNCRSTHKYRPGRQTIRRLPLSTSQRRSLGVPCDAQVRPIAARVETMAALVLPSAPDRLSLGVDRRDLRFDRLGLGTPRFTESIRRPSDRPQSSLLSTLSAFAAVQSPKRETLRARLGHRSPRSGRQISIFVGRSPILGSRPSLLARRSSLRRRLSPLRATPWALPAPRHERSGPPRLHRAPP